MSIITEFESSVCLCLCAHAHSCMCGCGVLCAHEDRKLILDIFLNQSPLWFLVGSQTESGASCLAF